MELFIHLAVDEYVDQSGKICIYNFSTLALHKCICVAICLHHWQQCSFIAGINPVF
jgi:hypothetical protein